MPATCTSLSYGFASATIAAAVAAEAWVGRGDERAAGEAAAAAMRKTLNSLACAGRIVIGETDGEILTPGETVGTGDGVELDIALEALEGTPLTVKAMPNAISVIAAAPKGALLKVPDVYMEKLAVGPGLPPGVVDIDADAGENAQRLAGAKGVDVREITACVLDRPRHAKIISDLRRVGARINLIPDGDVAGVIKTTLPELGVDMYVGQGKAPEAVLAAAALRCVGGQIQTRFAPKTEAERLYLQRLGFTDTGRRYQLDDLVAADAIFAATGVTAGALLGRVRRAGRVVETESVVMTSCDGVVRRIHSSIPAEPLRGT